MEKNHFVSVAGLVLNKNGKILLIKSPNRGWEFPGGMVEPGEGLQEALIREILEESGIAVQLVGFVGVCKNLQMDTVNIDFICEAIGGTPTTSEESLEVAWFAPNDVLNLITNPLTKQRMTNMLSHKNLIHCFSFTKKPFQITSDIELKLL